MDLPRHHGHSNIEDDRSSEGGFECQGRRHSIRQSSSEKSSDLSTLRMGPSTRSPRSWGSCARRTGSFVRSGRSYEKRRLSSPGKTGSGECLQTYRCGGEGELSHRGPMQGAEGVPLWILRLEGQGV